MAERATELRISPNLPEPLEPTFTAHLAWLFLTKGLSAEEARSKADISGDAALVEPFFGALAVMA